MASIATLRHTAEPPPLSPERAALAEAIAAHDAATARLSDLRKAADRARTRSYSDGNAVEVAESAVTAAMTADTAALTAELVTGTRQSASTLAAARAVLQQAEDTASATKSAIVTIAAEIKEIEHHQWHKRSAVDRALSSVLAADGAPAIGALVAELDSLHRQIVDRHLALHSLINSNAVSTRENESLTVAGRVALRFGSRPEGWVLQALDTPVRTAWTTAIAALKTDAATPLPE